MWHDRAYKNGDEDSSKNEKQANVIHHWKSSICEENSGTASPSNCQVPDEDMPSFRCVFWVVEPIHGDSNLAADACHCG